MYEIEITGLKHLAGWHVEETSKIIPHKCCIPHEEEMGILGEMADSRSGERASTSESRLLM